MKPFEFPARKFCVDLIENSSKKRNSSIGSKTGCASTLERGWFCPTTLRHIFNYISRKVLKEQFSIRTCTVVLPVKWVVIHCELAKTSSKTFNAQGTKGHTTQLFYRCVRFPGRDFNVKWQKIMKVEMALFSKWRTLWGCNHTKRLIFRRSFVFWR